MGSKLRFLEGKVSQLQQQAEQHQQHQQLLAEKGKPALTLPDGVPIFDLTSGYSSDECEIECEYKLDFSKLEAGLQDTDENIKGLDGKTTEPMTATEEFEREYKTDAPNNTEAQLQETEENIKSLGDGDVKELFAAIDEVERGYVIEMPEREAQLQDTEENIEGLDEKGRTESVAAGEEDLLIMTFLNHCRNFTDGVCWDHSSATTDTDIAPRSIELDGESLGYPSVSDNYGDDDSDAGEYSSDCDSDGHSESAEEAEDILDMIMGIETVEELHRARATLESKLYGAGLEHLELLRKCPKADLAKLHWQRLAKVRVDVRQAFAVKEAQLSQH